MSLLSALGLTQPSAKPITTKAEKALELKDLESKLTDLFLARSPNIAKALENIFTIKQELDVIEYQEYLEQQAALDIKEAPTFLSEDEKTKIIEKIIQDNSFVFSGIENENGIVTYRYGMRKGSEVVNMGSVSLKAEAEVTEENIRALMVQSFKAAVKESSFIK